MNPIILIFALVVGALFSLVTFLISYSGKKKKKETARNLILERNASVSVEDSNADTDNKNSDQPKISNVDKKQISKKLKEAAKSGSVEGLSKTSVRYLILQAGLETPMYSFVIWSVISGVLVLGLCYMAGASTIATALLGFTGFFGLPRFVLRSKVKRRQQKFLEDFPDCLEAMMRLLKSGMPITEAIAMTAREYTGPVGEEMSRVYEAQRVGDTLPQAVQKLAIRVPIPEVQMFATAVIIQTQTGSSLSEVLANLSNVIRQRFRLKRKVQALSAEAKISAGIIACLPVVVILAMYALNREYIALLWTTETGKNLSYGALIWMGAGVLIMRQMINFKA